MIETMPEMPEPRIRERAVLARYRDTMIAPGRIAWGPAPREPAGALLRWQVMLGLAWRLLGGHLQQRRTP